jgi:hypothetical protein
MDSTNGTEPRAFQVIKSYLPSLYYIVGGAVEDWLAAAKQVPRIMLAKTNRGQANLIYDFILLRVREALGPLDGSEVEIREEYDSVIIRLIKSGVLIKFNKLDDEKRVHPPNTQRAIGFYWQQARLFANDNSVEGVTIVVGYRLAFGGGALADVVAQCQEGDNVEWAYTIEPPADDQYGVAAKITDPTPKPGFTVGDKAKGQDVHRKVD